MNNLLIRECRKEDLFGLNQRLPTSETAFTHEKYFEKQVKGEATYLLAILNNILVGHVVISWASNSPELIALRVIEQYQNKGIGTSLLKSAEWMVESRGYLKAHLVVSKRNITGQGFYRKLGYLDTKAKSKINIYLEKRIRNKTFLYGLQLKLVKRSFKRLLLSI